MDGVHDDVCGGTLDLRVYRMLAVGVLGAVRRFVNVALFPFSEGIS